MNPNKPHRFKSLHYLLTVLIFLICVDALALWLTARTDYNYTLHRAYAILQKSSLSLEERMQRTVIGTDAILRIIHEKIESTGMGTEKPSAKDWEWLANMALGLPDKGFLVYIDKNANLVLHSKLYPTPQVNYSEREHFKAHREQGAEFYVGPVVLGKISKKYNFSISRRITGKRGEFLGVILVAIETDNYAEFLKYLDIGQGSTVSVFRTDGSLVLRQPMQYDLLGKIFTNLKWFPMLANNQLSGIYETDGIDGVRRLVAYRKIANLPLIAATTVPIDSIMSGWRYRVKIYSAVSIAMFFALITLGWVVRRTTLSEEKQKVEELHNANVALQTEIDERKRAEEELRRSEERSRSYFELGLIGMAITSPTQGWIEINDNVCEMLGYERDELMQKTWADMTHPDDLEADVASFNRVMAGELDGYSIDKRFIRKNGQVLFTTLSTRCIRRSDGSVDYFVVLLQDITRRKQDEQALLASKEALRRRVEEVESLMEVAPVALWVCYDPQCNEIIGNRVANSFYEAHEEENVSANFSSARRFFLNGKELKPEELPMQLSASKNIDIRDAELDVILPSGKTLNILGSATPLLTSDGRVRGSVGAFIDITERKNMEEALRQSEQKYRIMGETVPYGVWLCDPNGGALYVSQSFLDLLEMTQEEQQQFGWTHRLPPEDVEPMMEKWMHCIQTGEPWDSEHRILGPDGKYHTVLTRGLPVRNEDGEITCWVGINLDIDERKKIEQELHKYRDELERRVEERTAELQEAYASLQHETKERQKVEEQLRQSQKMEAIGTLAGGIAHDFNNILAAILGFTEMAIDDSADLLPVDRSLQNIHKSALRARDLVKQILAFSRKTNYERVPLSPTPIIKETILLVRASIPADIQISLRIETASDTIIAAPIEVQQIIMNLATNASLAMEEKGGTLDICLSNVNVLPESPVFESDLVPAEYVQLMVKDTGTGMSPEVMKRAFEPFFTTRGPGMGTGMGLAVVYGIVTDLQGTITVESEPGIGSTFRVFLPKVKAKIKAEDIGHPQTATGTESILFVDDEDMLVEWAKATLEKLGYRVTAVTDPVEALKILSSDPSRFDLVITDQSMPSMSGMTLAKKAITVRPGIPIILCTGHSLTASPAAAKTAGVKEFLAKPVSRQELARVIRHVLDEYSW